MTIGAIVVGICTGIVSGFGVGGGTLLLLYLTAVMGMEQYAAGGINLLYFLCCAPAALVSHIRQRRVDWQAVLWCTVTGVVTSVTFSLIASALPAQLLRRLFGVLLLYVGSKELFSHHQKTAVSVKSDKKLQKKSK